jgi:hypothetical protein
MSQVSFKGIVYKGSLVKLEKHVDGEKVAECGIDSQEAQQLWGEQQPLRAEYEHFVSLIGAPEYILTDSLPELEELLVQEQEEE